MDGDGWWVGSIGEVGGEGLGQGGAAGLGGDAEDAEEAADLGLGAEAVVGLGKIAFASGGDFSEGDDGGAEGAGHGPGLDEVPLKRQPGQGVDVAERGPAVDFEMHAHGVLEAFEGVVVGVAGDGSAEDSSEAAEAGVEEVEQRDSDKTAGEIEEEKEEGALDVVSIHAAEVVRLLFRWLRGGWVR
jgi:hypothetical protein